MKYQNNKEGEIITWVLLNVFNTHEILHCDKQRRVKIKTVIIFSETGVRVHDSNMNYIIMQS